MLKDKLKIIVKYSVHPDDVRFIVDEKPVIDTLNKNNKYALLMADIEIDDQFMVSKHEINNSERVMYWKLKENKVEVDIIGIAWVTIGKIKMFEGRILTP
jgi:hypothetical protein